MEMPDQFRESPVPLMSPDVRFTPTLEFQASSLSPSSEFLPIHIHRCSFPQTEEYLSNFKRYEDTDDVVSSRGSHTRTRNLGLPGDSKECSVYLGAPQRGLPRSPPPI